MRSSGSRPRLLPYLPHATLFLLLSYALFRFLAQTTLDNEASDHSDQRKLQPRIGPSISRSPQESIEVLEIEWEF